MKKAVRATFGLLLASAPASAGENVLLPPEARRVKHAYALLAAAPEDKAAQRAYLEAFPSDLKTFSEVFLPENPPHLDGPGHIAPLEHIGRGLPEATFEKVLKIEAGAKWNSEGNVDGNAGGEAGEGEAQGLDHNLDQLQAVTLKLALAHPKAFAAAVSGLRPVEQRGVAAFLADGPHGPPERALGLAAKLEVAGFAAFARRLREEARLSEAHHDPG